MNNTQGIANQRLHHVLETFSNETKNDRPDFRTLIDLMHTINILFHQEFATSNRQDLIEMLDEIRLQVAAVVSAHNKLGRTVSLVLSGVISAGAGGLGAAGAYWTNETAIQAAQHLAPFAKVPEILSSLFNDWKDVQLEKERSLQKELETKQGMVMDDARMHSSKVDQAMQAAQQADQLFREAMNAFSQPISAH